MGEFGPGEWISRRITSPAESLSAAALMAAETSCVWRELALMTASGVMPVIPKALASLLMTPMTAVP